MHIGLESIAAATYPTGDPFSEPFCVKIFSCIAIDPGGKIPADTELLNRLTVLY